jgi:hypothetical protein
MFDGFVSHKLATLLICVAAFLDLSSVNYLQQT